MSLTVRSTYLTLCSRILEPGGLQLGLVTLTQLLVYFADVYIDFMRSTGISKTFVSQPIEYATPIYTNPDRLIDVEAVFVQGRFKPRTNLESLDNSRFRWREKIGPVDVWHEDGIAINQVSLVSKPDWSGAQYPAQTNAPGYQYIDGTQVGQFAGTLTANGSNLLVLVSGNPFYAIDTTWFGKQIILGGTTAYTIAEVYDQNNLLVVGNVPVAVGVQYTVNYPIAIPVSDRNLTCYGSQMADPEAWTLDTVIPMIPDSAVLYLGWGCLARLFGDNSELRDARKEKLCTQRFQEGVSLFRAILEQELDDYDSE